MVFSKRNALVGFVALKALERMRARRRRRGRRALRAAGLVAIVALSIGAIAGVAAAIARRFRGAAADAEAAQPEPSREAVGEATAPANGRPSPEPTSAA
ncbi:MAG: hypothetical protein KatS3mg012_1373 [Gaiellaceae bacterium]|jgi:hypothetical protein|nr:MAG: hypothetical protein KatS3mg012_1373 [Gaiellaceae bacterium]